MTKLQPIAESCIYTLLHTDTLNAAMSGGGSGDAVENKVWVTGENLFNQAQKNGRRMLIIFAAAEWGPPGLLYYATLTAVNSDKEKRKTSYRYCDLRKIPNAPALSSLKKLSDHQPLSDNFIRPYCICRTPSFLIDAG